MRSKGWSPRNYVIQKPASSWRVNIYLAWAFFPRSKYQRHHPLGWGRIYKWFPQGSVDDWPCRGQRVICTCISFQRALSNIKTHIVIEYDIDDITIPEIPISIINIVVRASQWWFVTENSISWFAFNSVWDVICWLWSWLVQRQIFYNVCCLWYRCGHCYIWIHSHSHSHNHSLSHSFSHFRLDLVYKYCVCVICCFATWRHSDIINTQCTTLCNIEWVQT